MLLGEFLLVPEEDYLLEEEGDATEKLFEAEDH